MDKKKQEFTVDIGEQSLILNFGNYSIHLPEHNSSGFSKSVLKDTASLKDSLRIARPKEVL
ncbi:hypothetical protein H1P_620003 [Hyella patelloides LEGE 07179]|uniref:Uncharacterized protein n=1 Tax=Hyella patelloides LEGE 07179 TaxID=945734 RepID=A0A563W1B2_9CYAN|nr:hypothetical protein H1P_620003 [Hyella patelloides LEGE 07179]